jgi:hypothetical protein
MQYRLLSALALAGALVVGWFAAPASAVPSSSALAQTGSALDRASTDVVNKAYHRRYHRKFRRHLRRKLRRHFRHARPYYRKRHHYRKRRYYRRHHRPRYRKHYYRRYHYGY